LADERSRFEYLDRVLKGNGIQSSNDAGRMGKTMVLDGTKECKNVLCVNVDLKQNALKGSFVFDYFP
jgi:hypothetical protein